MQNKTDTPIKGSPAIQDSEIEHKTSLDRLRSEGGARSPSDSSVADGHGEHFDLNPSVGPQATEEQKIEHREASPTRKDSIGDQLADTAKKFISGLLDKASGSSESLKNKAPTPSENKATVPPATEQISETPPPLLESSSESDSEAESANDEQDQSSSREEITRPGAQHSKEGVTDKESNTSESLADRNKELEKDKEESEDSSERAIAVVVPSKSQSIKDIPALSIPPAKSPDMHSRGESPTAFERKNFNMFATSPSPKQVLLMPDKLSPSPRSPQTSHSPRRLMVDKPRGAERLRSPGIERKWEDLGLEIMPWKLLEGQHFFELEYPSRRSHYFRRLPHAVCREKATEVPLAPPSPLAHTLMPR